MRGTVFPYLIMDFLKGDMGYRISPPLRAFLYSGLQLLGQLGAKAPSCRVFPLMYFVHGDHDAVATALPCFASLADAVNQLAEGRPSTRVGCFLGDKKGMSVLGTWGCES